MNFHVAPIGEAKLRELLMKMKMSPRALLRKGEAAYREARSRYAWPALAANVARVYEQVRSEPYAQGRDEHPVQDPAL